MNCINVQDRLVEYALDDMAPSDKETVEAHLRQGCDECQKQLSELSEDIDTLYDSIPSRRESEDKVREIVHSVVNHGLAAVAPPTESALSRPNRFAIFDSLLFVASFAAGLLLAITTGGLDFLQPRTTPYRRPAQALSTTEDNQIVRTSMPARNTTSPVSGVLLYDPFLRELHFFAPTMTQPAPGQRYVLKIFQGDDEKLEPIHIDSNGIGTATIDDVAPDGSTAAVIELQNDTPPGAK